MAVTTDVSICNQALGHLGKPKIQALTDDTTEARQCNLHYEPARDYLLSKHWWSFAQKYLQLADLGNPPLGWSNEYAYPSDCLRAIKLVTSIRNDENTNPFKVANNGTQKVILCDIEEATLLYVSKVTNAGFFDAAFAKAFAYYLASELAMPLTSSRALKDEMFDTYLFTLRDAQVLNLNEATQDDPNASEFESIRN